MSLLSLHNALSATVGSIVRVPLLAHLNATDPSCKIPRASPTLLYQTKLTDIRPTDSIINPGIWLNVEANIGIISVSLPMLRPIFSKAIPTTLRSKFSRSRTPRYATGSQRLRDVEKGNTGRSSTLVGSNGGENNNVYSGGGKSHRTWYNTAVSAMGSKNDDRGSEGSQEEIIPMGQIAVRHEVDWETKDNASAVTPHV